jgi:hypothetical protein
LGSGASSIDELRLWGKGGHKDMVAIFNRGFVWEIVTSYGVNVFKFFRWLKFYDVLGL